MPRAKVMAKRIVTHSELQTLKDCARKWHLRYNMGMRRKRDSMAALSGTAGHRALELHYKGRGMDSSVRGIRGVYDEYIKRNADTLTVDEVHSLTEMCRQSIVVHQNYLSYWGDNDFIPAIDPSNKRPMVEVEFRIPVYTTAGRASSMYWLAGKVDLVADTEAGLVAVDHKFRDAIPKNMYDRLTLDQQARLYAYALTVYLGKPIVGFAYNILRRQAPKYPAINKDGSVSVRPCDTTREIFVQTLKDQQEYLSRLSPEEKRSAKLVQELDLEKYAEILEKLDSNEFFSRGFQPYFEKDLRQVQHDIYETTQMMSNLKWYYQNDAACDHWGGCPFRPICMGLPTEGLYDIVPFPHQELKQDNIHVPQGRGYVLDPAEDLNRVEIESCEDQLEAVNA